MEKTSFSQMLKFFLFSTSAGIIQTGVFALLHDWLRWLYWPAYLIALTASVVWNFTFNRRYTFKSAANIPIAMAKVAGFYAVFTPVSTWLGQIAADAGKQGHTILAGCSSWLGQWATSTEVNDYVILLLTMLCNLVLEFLFCKLVVYRNQENTRVEA